MDYRQIPRWSDIANHLAGTIPYDELREIKRRYFDYISETPDFQGMAPEEQINLGQRFFGNDWDGYVGFKEREEPAPEPPQPTGPVKDMPLGDVFKQAIKRGHGQARLVREVVKPGAIDPESAAEAISILKSIPYPEVLKNVAEAETLGGMLREVAADPVRSLGSLVTSSAVAFGETALVPTIAGGAIGTAVGPKGSAAGAAIGRAVGSATGSLLLEGSATFFETFEELGVDTSDAIALGNALQDDAMVQQARSAALKKGLPIALFDGLSAGMAGRVFKAAGGGEMAQNALRAKGALRDAVKAAKAKNYLEVERALSKSGEALKANRVLRAAGGESKIKNAGALSVELASQMAMGGAGEAAGQMVHKGEIYDPSAILGEVLAELPTGAVEIALGIQSDASAQQKADAHQAAVEAGDPVAAATPPPQKSETGIKIADVPDELPPWLLANPELAQRFLDGETTPDEIKAQAVKEGIAAHDVSSDIAQSKMDIFEKTGTQLDVTAHDVVPAAPEGSLEAVESEIEADAKPRTIKETDIWLEQGQDNRVTLVKAPKDIGYQPGPDKIAIRISPEDTDIVTTEEGEKVVEQVAMELSEVVDLIDKFMGKQIEAVDQIAGSERARGAYDPARQVVMARRDLADKPEQAVRTIAHELGHVVRDLPEGYHSRSSLFAPLMKLNRGIHDFSMRALKLRREGKEHDPLDAGINTLEDHQRISGIYGKTPEQARVENAAAGETFAGLTMTPTEIVNASLSQARGAVKAFGMERLNEDQRANIVLQAAMRIPEELRAGVASGNPRSMAALKAEVLKETKMWLNFEHKQIVGELARMSLWWRDPGNIEDRNYMNYRLRPEELVADAYSVFINNPQEFRERAPMFSDMVYQFMHKNPKFRDEYNRIQDVLNQPKEKLTDMRLEDIGQRIENETITNVRKVKEALPAPPTFFERLLTKFADQDFTNRLLPQRYRKRGGKVDDPKQLQHLLDVFRSQPMASEQYNAEIMGDIVPILQKIGLDIHDREQYKKFLSYLFVRRAKDLDVWTMRAMQGEPSEKAYQQFRAELGEKKAAQLDKAMDNWWKLRSSMVIAAARKARSLSPAQLDKAEASSNYVTFEHQIKDGMVHKMWGSLQNIEDPFQNTIVKDNYIMYNAARTEAAREVLSLLSGMDQLRQEGEAQFAIRAKPMKVGKEGKMMFPKPPRGYGLIDFMDNGKRVGYFVPKQYAKTFEAMPETMGFGIKAMGHLHGVVRRLLIDYAIPFAVRNFQRDNRFMAKAIIQDREPTMAAIKTFIYNMKAVPHALQELIMGSDTEVVRYMKRNTTLWSGSVYQKAADRDAWAVDANATERITSMGTDPRKRSRLGRELERVDKILSLVSSFSERLPRIAAFLYLKENQQKFGLTDDAINYKVKNLSGTPNVIRRGDWYKTLNTLFLFSNARTQGIRQQLEAATDDPVGYTMKTLAYDVVPKLVMIGSMYGAMNWLWGDELGEELKRWYKLVPEWDKRNYTIMPLGVTSDNEAVYLAFPQDHGGQMINSLLYETYNDEKKVSSLWKMLGDEFPFSPDNIHPVIDTGVAWWQYAQGVNPIDTHRGRPWVPERAFSARLAPGGAKVAREEMLAKSAEELGFRNIHNFNSRRKKDVVAELERFLSGPRDEVPGLAAAIDKALGQKDTPILGPALKSIIRVSDWGSREKLIEFKAAEDAVKDLATYQRDEAIQDILRANKELSNQQVAEMLRSQGIKTNRYTIKAINRWRTRIYGTDLQSFMTYATSKEMRRKIMEEFGEND